MGATNNEELYKKLMEGFSRQFAKLKEELKDDQQNFKSELQEQNNQVLIKIDNYTKNFSGLSEKCGKLEVRCTELERLSRKNNIIVFGLQVTGTSDVLHFLKSKLKELLHIELQDIDVNNIYILKAKKGTPIKVEFTTYLKKSEVIKSAFKLTGKNVYIAQDMCYQDRQEHKILRNYLNQAKERKLNCKIQYYKLNLNGILYTAKQLEENAEDIFTNQLTLSRSTSNQSLESGSTEEEATPTNSAYSEVDKIIEKNQELSPVQTLKRKKRGGEDRGTGLNNLKEVALVNTRNNARIFKK